MARGRTFLLEEFGSGGGAGFTINTIPKAGTPTTLIDSALSDNGTIVSSTESFQMAASKTIGWSDIVMFRDVNNQLPNPSFGFRNGTTPTELVVYNTYTSATSFEALAVGADANNYYIIAEKGASGGSYRSINVGNNSANHWVFRTLTGGTGNFDPATDNAFGIGDATHRVTNMWSVAVTTSTNTVAALPGAPVEGMRASVRDSNATSFTLGIGAIVVGGGSTHVPVYYDGTNWRIG